MIVSSSRKRTLYDFKYQSQLKAKNGSGGQGSQKTGRNGENLIIEVPVGTLVSDADTGKILKDFVTDADSLLVAEGGRGGLGNRHFKTATHQTPRFAQPGETGTSVRLKLELKLLADIGIIGLPNAGKSTLISKISKATPKIDAYPFTTLTPNLGVVTGRGGTPFVVADIPGLIEGAHKGAGLGIRFLKHIERTRILLHLIDASALKAEDVLSSYRMVMHELEQYSQSLAGKPQLIALNKMDLTGAAEKAELFRAALTDKEILTISALTKEGLDNLMLRIVGRLEATGQGIEKGGADIARGSKPEEDRQE